MKIRMMLRQIQEVPAKNKAKQKELEHRSDLAALRLGMPLPSRFRPFTGNLATNVRIHEREFDSIVSFTKLQLAWMNDEECQKIDEEWEQCFNWERRELLYVDDPNEPRIPWLQMSATQDYKPRYTVNPNYQMPKDQDNYRG
ncbi:MAG: hypothetical protein FWF81_01865 [Defluviitaleaceae bacterium]|nr:hypothetical protein [Defluviitaleaceae bacterium]